MGLQDGLVVFLYMYQKGNVLSWSSVQIVGVLCVTQALLRQVEGLKIELDSRKRTVLRMKGIANDYGVFSNMDNEQYFMACTLFQTSYFNKVGAYFLQ